MERWHIWLPRDWLGEHTSGSILQYFDDQTLLFADGRVTFGEWECYCMSARGMNIHSSELYNQTNGGNTKKQWKRNTLLFIRYPWNTQRNWGTWLVFRVEMAVFEYFVLQIMNCTRPSPDERWDIGQVKSSPFILFFTQSTHFIDPRTLEKECMNFILSTSILWMLYSFYLMNFSIHILAVWMHNVRFHRGSTEKEVVSTGKWNALFRCGLRISQSLQ